MSRLYANMMIDNHNTFLQMQWGSVSQSRSRGEIITRRSTNKAMVLRLMSGRKRPLLYRTSFSLPVHVVIEQRDQCVSARDNIKGDELCVYTLRLGLKPPPPLTTSPQHVFIPPVPPICPGLASRYLLRERRSVFLQRHLLSKCPYRCFPDHCHRGHRDFLSRRCIQGCFTTHPHHYTLSGVGGHPSLSLL